MATRTPLVIVAGEVQQLQSGDTLNVPFSETLELTLTNGNAAPVVIGAPVYISAAGSFDKAKADAPTTSKVIGVVSSTPSIANATSGQVATDGVVTATTVQWDAVVTGASGGLVANTDYYLDPTTAGKLTTSAPTATAQYVVAIGRAINTTDMQLMVQRRILL